VCSSLKRLRCVPNGLDIHKYQLHHQSRSHDLVLPASFRYEPNVVGAQILRDDVLPAVRQVIPDARLVLLGRDPLGMAKALQREPDVVATGEVASTQSFFLSAGVIAVPLFQGGGTRYKILEALALGCPVVTTPLGCEGLEVRNGEHLLIRDINDFSSAIIALLSDSSTSTALGHRGRRLVEAYYSWEAVEAQVRNALSTERHGQPPSHPQSTLIRGQ
jgi:polysaccharide biosynthesis protein PslH